LGQEAKELGTPIVTQDKYLVNASRKIDSNFSKFVFRYPYQSPFNHRRVLLGLL